LDFDETLRESFVTTPHGEERSECAAYKNSAGKPNNLDKCTDAPMVVSPGSALVELMMNSKDIRGMYESPPAIGIHRRKKETMKYTHARPQKENIPLKEIPVERSAVLRPSTTSSLEPLGALFTSLLKEGTPSLDNGVTCAFDVMGSLGYIQNKRVQVGKSQHPEKLGVDLDVDLGFDLDIDPDYYCDVDIELGLETSESMNAVRERGESQTEKSIGRPEEGNSSMLVGSGSDGHYDNRDEREMASRVLQELEALEVHSIHQPTSQISVPVNVTVHEHSEFYCFLKACVNEKAAAETIYQRQKQRFHGTESSQTKPMLLPMDDSSDYHRESVKRVEDSHRSPAQAVSDDCIGHEEEGRRKAQDAQEALEALEEAQREIKEMEDAQPAKLNATNEGTEKVRKLTTTALLREPREQTGDLEAPIGMEETIIEEKSTSRIETATNVSNPSVSILEYEHESERIPAPKACHLYSSMSSILADAKVTVTITLTQHTHSPEPLSLLNRLKLRICLLCCEESPHL